MQMHRMQMHSFKPSRILHVIFIASIMATLLKAVLARSKKKHV